MYLPELCLLGTYFEIFPFPAKLLFSQYSHVTITCFHGYFFIFGNSRRAKASEMSLKESRVATPQKHSKGQLSGLLPFILLKALCASQPQVRLESPVNSRELPAFQLLFKRTSGQSWQEWSVQSVWHPMMSAVRDPERNVKIRSNQTLHPWYF